MATPRRRARLRLLLGHRAPLRRLQPRPRAADGAVVRRRPVPADGARVDGRRAAVERPAARDRADRDPRLPVRRPAAARHRQGRGGTRVQRVRHGSRRGPPAVRGQPRPAARGAPDGRAAPRGRARHRDPPDAAGRLQGPHPDGRRLPAVARPRRRRRPAAGAHHPARLGGGGRAGRAPPGAFHGRRRLRAAAVRAAHLRLLRPRRRQGCRARPALRPRLPARRPSTTTGWPTRRTTCAGSPRTRSGARPTRSSRSARPPRVPSAPTTSRSRSATRACRTRRPRRRCACSRATCCHACRA